MEGKGTIQKKKSLRKFKILRDYTSDTKYQFGEDIVRTTW